MTYFLSLAEIISKEPQIGSDPLTVGDFVEFEELIDCPRYGHVLHVAKREDGMDASVAVYSPIGPNPPKRRISAAIISRSWRLET